MDVQDEAVLLRLASTPVTALPDEARVARCRSMRELHACGQEVRHSLLSCGHASLCIDCAHRFPICPICRSPINPDLSNSPPIAGSNPLYPAETLYGSGNPIDGDAVTHRSVESCLQLRLYDAYVEAGLIFRPERSWKVCSQEAGRQGKGGSDEMASQPVDVQRLVGLFNVALDHGMVPVICSYVEGVCFNDSLVSGDPVLALLLDPSVVLLWARGTFASTLSMLHSLYSAGISQFSGDAATASSHLRGVLQVLSTLSACTARGNTQRGSGPFPSINPTSSWGGRSPSNPNSRELEGEGGWFESSADVGLAADVAVLSEGVQRAMQHLSLMEWASRHGFFSSLPARHVSQAHWSQSVRQRKEERQRRCWPVIFGIGGDGKIPANLPEDAEGAVGKGDRVGGEVQDGRWNDNGVATNDAHHQQQEQEEQLRHLEEKSAELFLDRVFRAAFSPHSTSSPPHNQTPSSYLPSSNFPQHLPHSTSFPPLMPVLPAHLNLSLLKQPLAGEELALGQSARKSSLPKAPGGLSMGSRGLFGTRQGSRKDPGGLDLILGWRSAADKTNGPEDGAERPVPVIFHYPPENFRAVVDFLSLEAEASREEEKKAALLFYLLDRFYDSSTEASLAMLQDYASSLSLPARCISELLLALHLDDPSDASLQEASSLLPLLLSRTPPSLYSTPNAVLTNPWLPRVLLERDQADPALALIRATWQEQMTGGTWTSEEEGGGLSWSLRDDVTITRVLMANGLLTEAFFFARQCFERLGGGKGGRYETKERDRRAGGGAGDLYASRQHAQSAQTKGSLSAQQQQQQGVGFSGIGSTQHTQEEWAFPGGSSSRAGRRGGDQQQLDGGFRVSPNAADVWVAGGSRGVAVCVLVSEIFWAALRSNSADRLLGLPWNKEEAAVLHCCLLARAQQQPRGGAGSLLVLLYLERGCYSAALSAHKQVEALEDQWLAANVTNDALTAAAPPLPAGGDSAAGEDAAANDASAAGQRISDWEAVRLMRSKRAQLVNCFSSLTLPQAESAATSAVPPPHRPPPSSFAAPTSHPQTRSMDINPSTAGASPLPGAAAAAAGAAEYSGVHSMRNATASFPAPFGASSAAAAAAGFSAPSSFPFSTGQTTAGHSALPPFSQAVSASPFPSPQPPSFPSSAFVPSSTPFSSGAFAGATSPFSSNPLQAPSFNPKPPSFGAGVQFGSGTSVMGTSTFGSNSSVFGAGAAPGAAASKLPLGHGFATNSTSNATGNTETQASSAIMRAQGGVSVFQTSGAFASPPPTLFGTQGPAFGAFGSKAAAVPAFGSSGRSFGTSRPQGGPVFGAFSSLGGRSENGGNGELPGFTSLAESVTPHGVRNNAGFQGGAEPSFRRVTDNPLFNSPPEDTENARDGRPSPVGGIDRTTHAFPGTSKIGGSFAIGVDFDDAEMQNSQQ